MQDIYIFHLMMWILKTQKAAFKKLQKKNIFIQVYLQHYSGKHSQKNF